LRNRFKEELKRLNISGAEAARRLGEKNRNRMTDVLGGRVRMPAELLASAVQVLGMDGSYVLTGQRSISLDLVTKLMQKADDLDELFPNKTITPKHKREIVSSALKTSQYLGEEIDQKAVIAAFHAVAGD
jgi:transcriptional regulator with XRE-family HTH domain